MRLLPALLLAASLATTGCGSDDGTGAAAPDAVAADTLADGASGAATTRDRLQGTWQATDDPRVEIEIHGDRFVERYNGEVMEESPLRIAPTCEGTLGGADGDYLIVGEDLCFALVSMTDSTLAYSLVGGRGNTLAFVRAPARGEPLGQGEAHAGDALFGADVCEALRPAVLTGETAGLERYATPQVLQALRADAAAGHAPDAEDVTVWAEDDGSCNIAAGGDAWYHLTLMGDGHVGQNAVAVEVRTSYD